MFRLIKNSIHLLVGLFSATYFKFPGREMTVIGVTGTSGKTTTTHLIYDILKNAHLKVSMVSTLKAIIDGQDYDTGFHVTTPSSFMLQKFMRQAVNQGSKVFILEVTSHGLDQFRTFGTSIDIAVITNVTHEHLDYHKNYRNYIKAKAQIMNGAKYVVINKDDKSFDYLQKKAKANVISFSVDGKSDNKFTKMKISKNLPGKFNLYNIMAARTVCKLLDIDDKFSERTIAGFSGITGRMEELKTDKPFKIIIDFAHKPDALEGVLRMARQNTNKKVIVLFGCAGLRDRDKRYMMGEIAGKLADYSVLTAEDPRTEDVREIIKSMASGCAKGGAGEVRKSDVYKGRSGKNDRFFIRIPDRQEAINFAVRNLAHKGDILLLCGKGHEQSMCYGKTEYPWDEKIAVQKAIYGTV